MCADLAGFSQRSASRSAEVYLRAAPGLSARPKFQMPALKRSLPTIGILPGWAVMEGKLPDRYLAAVLRSIQASASEQGCHLLLAWGLGRVTNVTGLHPAWPTGRTLLRRSATKLPAHGAMSPLCRCCCWIWMASKR